MLDYQVDTELIVLAGSVSAWHSYNYVHTQFMFMKGLKTAKTLYFILITWTLEGNSLRCLSHTTFSIFINKQSKDGYFLIKTAKKISAILYRPS